MTAIDEIKARIDIVELVSETVKLRHAGKNYTGFCPFHPNSRTPAFVVFPDSGTWRCFGQCNEGGDIFKYVMKKEGWDFPQALQALAQRAGVVLEPQTPERQAEDQHTERLRALLEEAVNFFRHNLLNAAGGKPALAYLQKRGLQPATIETFELGYAPDEWDAALRYFSGKKYTPEELLQTGLVTERQSGSGVYDRFRNRITFPIRDALGRMSGFGARILNPEDMPKFINSPQTELFDKGRLLYGLDKARKQIRAEDQVVIVEGYLDVIALHQGGFTNTVSPMGTALTEDQLRMLKRFTRRIVLALDADAAGAKATLRGLELTRQTLDRSDEISFDARGLLRHEARLQADVRVTTLPEGMDPDEVVLRDPQEWRAILDSAQPVVVHVMETLAAHRNLDDPKIKSEIAAQVLPLIEDVPDAVERDAYRQRLARLLRVDERALLEAVPARPQQRPSRRRPAAETPTSAAPLVTASPARRALELEHLILRLLLRQPDVLYLTDRSLQQWGLGRLGAQDFEAADYQVLARLLTQALEQDEQEPHQYILAHMPASLEGDYQELMALMQMGEPATEKILEHLVRSVLELRLIRVKAGLEQMTLLQRELQGQEDVLLEGYTQQVLQYSQLRDRLDRALKRPVGTE